MHGPPPPGDEEFFQRPRRFDVEGHSMGPGPEEPPFDEAGFRLAANGQDGYRDVAFEDKSLRVYTLPVSERGHVIAVVQVARNLADVASLWSIQGRTLLLFVPIAVVAGLLSALFLTSRALRPIESFTRTAEEITAKDLSRRMDVAGDDELASLGTTFNSMLGRLETAFQDLRTAYDDQRRFTADASHELRTPLARLLLTVTGALEEGADADQLRKALKVAADSGREMSELVDQLLLLARSDAGHLDPAKEPTDLRVLLAEEVDAFEGQPKVTLKLPKGPLNASVAPNHFRRAVRNLIQNALNHTDRTGQVAVSGKNVQGGVEVVVSDTGEGIEARHLPHLGERFYRVDTARTGGSGTGLGLAIVKTIVQAHGGTLDIQSEIGKGTTVKILLPTFSASS